MGPLLKFSSQTFWPSDIIRDFCQVQDYSESTRKVCFVELTSPAEENIQIWKLKKREKYINLIEEAKTNGWKAMCRTMEVGARGFVSKTSINSVSILG